MLAGIWFLVGWGQIKVSNGAKSEYRNHEAGEAVLMYLGQELSRQEPPKKKTHYLVSLDEEHAQKFREIKEYVREAVKCTNSSIVQDWIRDTHAEMLKEKKQSL